LPLKLNILRYPQGAPERKITKQPARRRHTLKLLTNRTDSNGRNASGLKNVGERTNSARAQRSDGRLEHHIDFIFLEKCSIRGTTVHPNTGQVKWIARKRQVHIGNSPDRSFIGKLFESVNGKHNVQIGHHAGCIEVRTPVPYNDVAVLALDDSIARFIPWETIVRWMMQRRRRDQGDRRLSERWWTDKRRGVEIGALDLRRPGFDFRGCHWLSPVIQYDNASVSGSIYSRKPSTM